MDTFIRHNNDFRGALIYRGLSDPKVFRILEARKLLDWNLVLEKSNMVTHVLAMKWLEQNGIDAAKNKAHFRNFARKAPVEVIEYLMVEKGMSVEFLAQNRTLNGEILRVILEHKGMADIQKLKVEQLWLNFDTVKFLRSVGFNFEKTLCLGGVSSKYDIYCLILLEYAVNSIKQDCKITAYEMTSKHASICINL